MELRFPNVLIIPCFVLLCMAAALEPGYVQVTVFVGTEIEPSPMGSTKFLYTADPTEEFFNRAIHSNDDLLRVLMKLFELQKSERGYGNHPSVAHSTGQHCVEIKFQWFSHPTQFLI